MLPVLFAGFIAGVALQLQQPALWAPAGLDGATFYAFCLMAAAIGLVLSFFFAGRSRVIMLLAGLMALGIGFSLCAVRAANFQQTALAADLEGKDIVITGRVKAMPQFGEDGLRFRFSVESAHLKEPGGSADAPGAQGPAVTLPPQILLGWYAGFGTRLATSAARSPLGAPSDADGADLPEILPELQRQPQLLRAGERWRMTVRLKAPHGNSNPRLTGLLTLYGHCRQALQTLAFRLIY